MTHFAFERAMGLLLLVLTVILSLIMIHSPGTDDVAAFLYWTEVVYQNGLAAGYTKVIDDPIIGDLHYFYPPLSFAILYIARAFGNAVALSPLISFKVMILTFQLVSAGIILLLSGSYWVAAAFNASLLLSGVGLGYMDVCVAPPLIVAFWAFQSKRNVLGTALFLIACLIKWQPLVLVPFIGIYLFQISDLRSWRDAVGGLLFWKIVVLVSATIVLLSLLFGLAPERALGYAMKCGFLSGNALNVPWVADFFYKFLFSHSFSPQAELGASTPGSMYLLPFRTIFWIIFGVVLMRAISSEGSFGNFLLFAIVGFLTYIMWNSGVHENHLFVVVVLAYMLMLYDYTCEHLAITVILTAMFNLNLFVFYGITGTQLQSRVVGVDLSIILAVLYAAVWLLLGIYAWGATQPRKAVETHLPAMASEPG